MNIFTSRRERMLRLKHMMKGEIGKRWREREILRLYNSDVI